MERTSAHKYGAHTEFILKINWRLIIAMPEIPLEQINSLHLRYPCFYYKVLQISLNWSIKQFLLTISIRNLHIEEKI